MLGRFITGLTVAIATLAAAVPFASAGSRITDDHFRDGLRIVKATPSIPLIVDDHWRDGIRNVKATQSTPLMVDDHFRDGLGVKATPHNLLVDDYFRDAPKPAVSGDGFDWGDFGIGIAVAMGAVLLLGGLGAGALAARHNRSGKTSPAVTT